MSAQEAKAVVRRRSPSGRLVALENRLTLNGGLSVSVGKLNWQINPPPSSALARASHAARRYAPRHYD